MDKPVAGLVALVGRVGICAIFVLSVVFTKIPRFNDVAAHMASEGIVLPKVALVLTIGLLLVGSVSVIVGYKARLGALLLFIFLVAATFYFHDFWNMDTEDAHVQQIMFMKNVSMIGTMLFIMAVGSGPWSLDACCCKKQACDTGAPA